MRFASQGAVAAAMASSLVSANTIDYQTHANLDLDLDLSVLAKLSHKTISASVSLDKNLSGQVLAAGVLAHATVGDIVEANQDLEISVICNECYTRGNIDATVSLEHVVPALSLTITDIEAKLDLDIKATDATSIAVNLLTASTLDLPFLGLDLAANIYLDLVIGVSAEVDISAGIEIELVDEAVVTTNILSGEIISAAFAGLEVDVLPIAVRIGCTELHATLRLRVELDGAVDSTAGHALSIVNVVPEVGAGLELAVFVNLAEYVGLFCPDASCPLPLESYGLNVGAIVELDVSVEDLASIHLAPTISTALLAAPQATHCRPGVPIRIGGNGPFDFVTGITAPGYLIGVPTGVPTGPAGGSPTATASASISGGASASASGNMSGSASGSAPASVTGTATGVAPGNPSASVTGGMTSESGFPTSDITIPPGYVVSTVTQTAAYTLTTCAVNIPNCPGPLQGETTLVHTTVYTTICPATAVITDMHPAPTPAETTATAAVPHVTAVPCSSVNTFSVPSQVAYPSSTFPTTVRSTTDHAGYPTHAARGYPVQPVGTTEAAPTTKHAEYPTGPAQEYPVESVATTTAAASTTKNVEYPTGPAQEYPVESVHTTTYPVESVGTTTTAGASTTEHAEYPTGPVQEYPEYPVESATTETHPVEEHPTTKPAYSTAAYYPSMPVPPVHNGTATYPADATYPAAATYPVAATHPAAPYPTAPTYPPVTMSTHVVAPTGGAYPTKPVYPTAPHSVETPVPTAGASKQVVGSGVVAAAAAGVLMALF